MYVLKCDRTSIPEDIDGAMVSCEYNMSLRDNRFMEPIPSNIRNSLNDSPGNRYIDARLDKSPIELSITSNEDPVNTTWSSGYESYRFFTCLSQPGKRCTSSRYRLDTPCSIRSSANSIRLCSENHRLSSDA